jgi:RimJ/RimL family protein N-acetyltransferase
VLAFAFHDLKAERVQASWFADSPASGRVLEKLGFEPVDVYRRESLARGGLVICNRCVLARENFGRKRSRLDWPDLQACAAGA